MTSESYASKNRCTLLQTAGLCHTCIYRVQRRMPAPPQTVTVRLTSLSTPFRLDLVSEKDSAVTPQTFWGLVFLSVRCPQPRTDHSSMTHLMAGCASQVQQASFVLVLVAVCPTYVHCSTGIRPVHPGAAPPSMAQCTCPLPRRIHLRIQCFGARHRRGVPCILWGVSVRKSSAHFGLQIARSSKSHDNSAPLGKMGTLELQGTATTIWGGGNAQDCGGETRIGGRSTSGTRLMRFR